MLIACESCHSQYDVGDLEPGRKVRCVCGALSTVPAATPRQVRMMFCSGCGGALREDETQCSYCSAEVTLLDRGLGPPCPSCFGRMPSGAGFCSSCGLKIEPRALLQALTDTACPRCEADLAAFDQSELPFYQCTGCHGVWLSNDEFAAFVARKRERARTFEGPLGLSTPDAQRGATREGNLSCPVCRTVMLSKRFTGSNVVIDRCFQHGIWLDEGELAVVAETVESGRLDEVEKRRRARRRAQARKAASRRTQRTKQESWLFAAIELVLTIGFDWAD